MYRKEEIDKTLGALKVWYKNNDLNIVKKKKSQAQGKNNINTKERTENIEDILHKTGRRRAIKLDIKRMLNERS